MPQITPDISVLPLRSGQNWNTLREALGGARANPAARIVAYLEECGAKSAVSEEEYLDRDYSAEYSAFYSTVFARYRRQTRRIHFFSAEIPDDVGLLPLALAIEANKQSYLGFVVVRPIGDAPIGRTVLGLPKTNDRLLEVRSEYAAHLLGVTLSVRAAPFIQQDNRLSACAQAAIWVCGRHAQNKHGAPWKSVVDITRDATNVTDEIIASSLPPGATRLGISSILRALREMGRQPYMYKADDFDEANGVPIWSDKLKPESIVTRYVRSGIPVIVTLMPNDDEPAAAMDAGVDDDEGETGPDRSGDGHIVVAVGCTFKKPSPMPVRDRMDWSVFVPHIVVHDDQEGPYLRMPVRDGAGDGESEYNLSRNALSIIIPLPAKVYVPAETAERVAWDYLAKYARRWAVLKAASASEISNSVALGDLVSDAVSRKKVISNTYLALGWKYKSRLALSGGAPAMIQFGLKPSLPRMVWVTEFGIEDDLCPADGNRMVFGHAVVDATSTGAVKEPLLNHFPGFMWSRMPQPPAFYNRSSEEFTFVQDDRKYRAWERDD